MDRSYASWLVKGKGAAGAVYLMAFLSYFSEMTTYLSLASLRPAAAASRCLWWKWGCKGCVLVWCEVRRRVGILFSGSEAHLGCRVRVAVRPG